MPTRAEAIALAERNTFGRIQRTTAARVGREWDALGAWNRDDIPRWLDRMLPLMVVAAAQTSATVDTSVAALVTEVTGRPADPIGIEAPAELRGIDPADVYQRPFLTTWKALADGKDNATALRAGRDLATVIAATDVMLAQRAAMDTAVRTVQVVSGYARTLTGASCPLCLAAEGRIGRQEPLPIHNGCDCGFTPVFRTLNPAAAANAAVVQERLSDPDAEGLALDEGEPALPEVEVHEHGELGPVLVRAGHRFTELGET